MFSIICNNKGCGKQMNPYIDKKDDKVYCSICNKELSNITYFAKVQMKSLKQFKEKNQTPFAVKCSKCGQEAQPKISKNDIVCGSCNFILDNLSEPFKIMLKEKLKTVKNDV